MGLSSLTSALSGLSIAQRQIDVISANVSNVGTPGYSRKILPQATQAVGGASAGVTAGVIMRHVDINLSESLWTQTSAVGLNSVQESYLNRIVQFHGPPDKELSVAAAVSKLQDSFAQLTSSPADPFLQSQTVNQAQDMAGKINEFSKLITTLRNDAQNEISDTVRQVNDLLDQIANLNRNIQSEGALGKSIAQAQDLRDKAVKDLSEMISISFFIRGDGVMVVQTNQGAELASATANKLTFSPSPVSPTIFYPDSAAGLFVGNPATDQAAVDITELSPGGRIGGLLQLRDEIFPKQMAQLDELAHKMALRFDAQGLRLFTDATGAIPADLPPDTTTDPKTAVPYVGFSATIRVNESIISDNSLLQKGTSGLAVQEGSDEVISRIIENTFGSIDHQEAIGTIDLSVSDNGGVNDLVLQPFLGVASTNLVEGVSDLENGFASQADFVAATNNFVNAGAGTFRLTFAEPDLGLGPVNIDVDITAVPDGAGGLTQDIIDHITATLIPALAAGDQADLTAMGVGFSVGSNGQLSMTSSGNITVDSTSPANAIGTNIDMLGLSDGTTLAKDPYFDIAVGSNDLTRITIEPGDDETDLLAKLNAVPDLAAQYGAGGELQLRPGNNWADPDFGGDLKIISGPFTVSGASANTVFGAGTIVDGINLVSAIFGSFNAGPPTQNLTPISDVNHASTVSTTSSSTRAFRETLLGPGANISTNILASVTLVDFSQKIVNEQSQQLILVQDRLEDEATFRDLIEDQVLRDSGVNLDEELAQLIVVQTAYAASARVVNAVDELFQDLLRAVG